MKKLTLILLTVFSINAFAQQNDDYKKFIEQIKQDSKVDKNDRAVFNLLNDFYEQALQSDEGELKPEIPQRIKKLFEDKNTKNIQILKMFFAYQDHVSKAAAIGKRPNARFQVNLMNDLESEIKNTYDKIPALIYIYKSEALSSDGQNKEAAVVVTNGLAEYPNSTPLKVYKYLNTKDGGIKEDLLKNHPNHWMINQFGIK